VRDEGVWVIQGDWMRLGSCARYETGGMAKIQVLEELKCESEHMEI
jgi:hypothetical protein